MPVRYFIDEDSGFLIGHASGILRARESIEALAEVMNKTKGAAFFKPHLYLVDDDTLLHELTFEGIIDIKESFAAWGRLYPGRNVRTAFVVPHKIHALYARLWQATTQIYRDIGSTVEIFDTEEEAVAWLRG